MYAFSNSGFLFFSTVILLYKFLRIIVFLINFCTLGLLLIYIVIVNDMYAAEGKGGNATSYLEC